MTEEKKVKKKSGIQTLKPGDILFNESDPASSLYILQRGKLRLFLPKGKGFVEIALVHPGEVIGEMAYFTDKGGRRSCSASAIVTTEVIEISFDAFDKTMEKLNPWFKTIINTLVTRLKKSNDRVKELEENSVGYGAGGKVKGYVFFHNIDVVRMIYSIFLSFKAHSKKVKGGFELHSRVLKHYICDIYNISEVKWEEFFNLLKTDGYIQVTDDSDGKPKNVLITDLDSYRNMAAFFNEQRQLDEDSKLKIAPKCEKFLKKILEALIAARVDKPAAKVDLSSIIQQFKQEHESIDETDLQEAVTAGFCGDIVINDSGKLTSVVQYEDLKASYPFLRLMNGVKRVNEKKASKGKYS